MKKILNLKILQIINILYWGRMFLGLAICLFVFWAFGLKKHISSFWGIIPTLFVGLISLITTQFIVHYLIIYISKKHKYSTVFQIVCNKIGLGGRKNIDKTQNINVNFDINEFNKDNDIPLKYYLISHPKFQVINFSQNKLYYHSDEFDWKTINWKYYTVRLGKGEKEISEFDGINQNYELIKRKIDYLKIDSKSYQILILFVVHDIIYGAKTH